MFIKNNNFLSIIFAVILLMCFFNLLNEKFKVVICPPGQVEGSDGKCRCPLVGQVYNANKNQCKCDLNKKETILEDRTVCL